MLNALERMFDRKKLMKRFAIIAALWACFSTPLLAFEINSMSDEERQIFREEVRAYLLSNPEVLIEAIGVLEQRQEAAADVGDEQLIAVNSAAIFDDTGSYVGGNLDGDIVMVEFLDYKCGFCKRAFPEVSELIRTDGNIRFIIKEFPILGEQSVLASRFAISVLQNADAETYAEVHDNLMAFRGEISTASLERLANTLGLDVPKIMEGMNADAVTAVIAENRALAQRIDINGTPGFVIGNQMVRGYMPLDGMRELISEIRLASQ